MDKDRPRSPFSQSTASSASFDVLGDDLIATTKANVCWKFIPPRGPHHGGIYERMVRVAKRVLENLCHCDEEKMLFKYYKFKLPRLLKGLGNEYY